MRFAGPDRSPAVCPPRTPSGVPRGGSSRPSGRFAVGPCGVLGGSPGPPFPCLWAGHPDAESPAAVLPRRHVSRETAARWRDRLPPRCTRSVPQLRTDAGALFDGSRLPLYRPPARSWFGRPPAGRAEGRARAPSPPGSTRATGCASRPEGGLPPGSSRPSLRAAHVPGKSAPVMLRVRRWAAVHRVAGRSPAASLTPVAAVPTGCAPAPDGDERHP